MSTLSFDRAGNRIIVTSGGVEVASFVAMNNVDSQSHPWPAGSYPLSHFKTHPNDAPDSAYGSVGIFVFDVPGHTGLGVHSGRQNVPDGLGRSGPAHCTNGCVRTTDAAMMSIKETHGADPLTRISIS